MDPVLFAMGLAGIAYSFKRKDYMIILWSAPFIVFLASIGHTNYFYWIPVLPAFSMAAAKLVFDVIARIAHYKAQKIITVMVISSIGAFGLISTMLIISTDVTSAQFESAAYVARYLHESRDITLISNPIYSWIFNYVYDKDHVFSDYRDLLYIPIRTDRRSEIQDGYGEGGRAAYAL
jgi:hypothetical protein